MSLLVASMVLDTSDLQRKLKRVVSDVDNQVSAICNYNADWGTAWMKLNAPWTDDTGAARASLIAIASNAGSSHEITVAHGVSYGIWLEVANSGKFQILAPAMRAIGRNVMASMQGLLDGKPPNISAPVQEIPPVARKAKPVTNKSGNRRSRQAYAAKNRRRKQP